MQIILANLFVAASLLVVLRGCLGQTGFCNEAHRKNPNTQVMEICTDQASRNSTVLIDTFQVSKFQDIICECNITPPGVDIEFYFSFYNTSMSVAKGMSFRIHTLVLNEIVMRGALHLWDVTSLRFFTSEQFENGGACLIVKTEHGPFDINCAQPETNSSQDVNKETHGYDYYIISSIVASVCIGCLLIVIPLGIFCKRKYRSKDLQSGNLKTQGLHGEQGDDHDADNPVFDISGTQSRGNSTAHDYNYIDHYHFCGNQYNHLSEQQYDCTRTVNQNNNSNKGIKSVDDSLYNTINANEGQLNQDADDYHHLGSVNVRKANIADKYNTVDVTGQRIKNGTTFRNQ
ncbi:uncharacterized protein LOC132758661 [Ruditapes philippinarum]|uniref:uncharacterized protein LOC132758661 n=1 Tax=Ruditapes philippinarum TaxID=129788 RepID=UPI00295AB196|nr:uncharacterized protein LOC132758661 [Ruditapes philippinarum]